MLYVDVVDGGGVQWVLVDIVVARYKTVGECCNKVSRL